ncbi:carboxylesterase family protein [Paenarthrobacter sp. NPDC091669]|uniref:carboxylesterase family protein n=1 Tax=Paenarthrobacter sp. NPDC091669 TaxID=3364384 RepID=UPI0038092404
MTKPDIKRQAVRVPNSLRKSVDCYLGIRFAEIEHRFAPPILIRDHGSKHVGSGYGPSPLQPVSTGLPPDLQFSEDCLNLNVWAPASHSGALPVVVWVYGGGFEGGSNASPLTNGSVLAALGPMVVVSLNYRVGALGFSYLADRGREFSHATNLGVQDVIAGLRWVNENIDNYGGEPTNITVIGESAGGFIAAALAAAPTAKGLYHRLALFSGGASRLVPLGQAKKQADALILALHADDPLAALASGPAHDVQTAQRAFTAEDIGIRNSAVPQALGVVLDGGTPNAVLQKHPMEAFSSGELSRIPILVSSTQDEISLFRSADPSRFDPPSSNTLISEMKSWGIPFERIAQLHQHYSSTGKTDPGSLKERMLTDWIYRLPALRLAQAHARAGGLAYLAMVPRAGEKPASHACDVNAIFGIPAAAETADESTRRAAITSAVVAFATTGQPGWAEVRGNELNASSFGDEKLDATLNYTLLLELWDGISRP